MDAIYLERITIQFPAVDDPFTGKFIDLIELLGQNRKGVIELDSSERKFFPKIFLDFQPRQSSRVMTGFTLSSHQVISIPVENSTNQFRRSPHSYRYLKIDQVQRRLVDSRIKMVGIDHAGINLPWFAPGLHPNIIQLRQQLAAKCLYHRFPSGEPWDFIIPGDEEEIRGSKPIDYGQLRRPKFEIVSFEKASTPLIQFDLQLEASYELLRGLFPEALDDPEIRNVWIYLENPYGVDLCLVANQSGEGDWSGFFAGARINE